jgi:hypothetical protein
MPFLDRLLAPLALRALAWRASVSAGRTPGDGAIEIRAPAPGYLSRETLVIAPFQISDSFRKVLTTPPARSGIRGYRSCRAPPVRVKPVRS